MNNKIIFSCIIFCCSNVLMSMEYRKTHPNQLQTWYPYKEINIAEKIIGTPQKEILRKSEEYYITAVCIDPSETSLAIASCDKKVRILDIHSEQMLESISFDNDITSLCFNHSGNQFAVASYEPATHFFDIQRNVNKKIISYNHHGSITHEKEISSIFFDYNNNICSVILDELHQTMNVINIIQNKKILSFPHNEWIKSGSVSPSKNFFVTGSGTKKARLFDLQKNSPICTFLLRGSANAFAFDKRENLLAIASNEPKSCINPHKIRIFDLKTFQEVASFSHKKYISTVCFSASGKTLVFGSFDGKVYIFKRR